WKLTLAFMLVAFITAGLVAIFIRATSADRLTRLIIDQQIESLDQELANYYKTNGSWVGVERRWLSFQLQNTLTPIQNPTQAPPPNELAPNGNDFFNRRSFSRDRRSLFGLADKYGRVIISVSREYPVDSRLPANVLSAGKTVQVDGQVVGTILTAPQQPDFNPAEALFLQRTTQALILAMIGALFVALTIGILLARTLTRPLQALIQAAQNIARGDLNQQVKVTSRDEIGQLALAFNRMSQEVARVNQLRRQMTADIAHDLRTPLPVIAGYIEAMRDGILQPTPQRLDLIYSEIERLQHLVTDLRMLSQVDAGDLPLHPQQIAPMQILERSAELFQHHAQQQNVTLRVEPDGVIPEIYVDEARIMQVMDNLIINALRYTPDGGKIILSAKVIQEKVDITIKDTGVGIASEELPHIFDRFHRVDKSRSQETGQSGLGLSIVKALVEAHHG
ncbi:MAG: HAMP domain-containing protein, partial [Anaerolineaceae bacterium]|nr:HAMP domain-containing protein [Anaerolineaceae bacterium]